MHKLPANLNELQRDRARTASPANPSNDSSSLLLIPKLQRAPISMPKKTFVQFTFKVQNTTASPTVVISPDAHENVPNEIQEFRDQLAKLQRLIKNSKQKDNLQRLAQAELVDLRALGLPKLESQQNCANCAKTQSMSLMAELNKESMEGNAFYTSPLSIKQVEDESEEIDQQTYDAAFGRNTDNVHLYQAYLCSLEEAKLSRKYQDKNYELKEQLEALQIALAKKTAQHEMLQNDLETLSETSEKEGKHRHEQLNSIQIKNSELAKQLEQKNRLDNELKLSNTQYLERIVQLNSKIERLTTALEQQTKTNEKLREVEISNEKLQSDFDKLTKRFCKSKQMSANLFNQCTVKEKNIVELNKMVAELETFSSGQTKAMYDIKKEYSKYRLTNEEQLTRVKSQFDKQIEDLKEQLAFAETEKEKALETCKLLKPSK